MVHSIATKIAEVEALKERLQQMADERLQLEASIGQLLREIRQEARSVPWKDMRTTTRRSAVAAHADVSEGLVRKLEMGRVIDIADKSLLPIVKAYLELQHGDS